MASEAVTRVEVSQRISELRKKNKNLGFGELYATLNKEGYKPEEFIFWLSEYLVVS